MEQEVPTGLSEEQWAEFWKQGFLPLGRVLTDEQLEELRERIDAIMLGKIQYDDLLMQLDPGGDYGSTVQSEQTVGWKGATRDYRKIGDAGQGLEKDDLFFKFMGIPLFKHLCAGVYGPHADIACYRAMLMNKPGKKGTNLPWHQDGGEWWGLDRDPLIFVWVALDPASQGNGCVQVIEGSHKLGLLSRRGHTLTEEQIQKHCDETKLRDLELAPGHAVLCHNFLIHRSGVNNTEQPRRGFSVNFIDARTVVKTPLGPCGKPGQSFPLLFRGTLGDPAAAAAAASQEGQ
ncbi:Phytanoyl-CoA dioxygenase [Balamuthia mandrillaris]